MTVELKTTFCRFCDAQCGIIVTVENGRPVKVTGDVQNPLSHGYTCAKGRSLPEQHLADDRLLHTMARQPDGSQARIDPDVAVAEIAERLKVIIDEHGPGSVAFYGGNGFRAPVSHPAIQALFAQIGSTMMYSAVTIDQPGKVTAGSMHGWWDGGPQDFDTADRWMFVGTNPIVSMFAGFFITNPSKRFRDARARGMRMVVIDPRITELTAFADVHLRPLPGQDPVVLAGIVRVLLHEGLIDKEFCDEHVMGIDALRAAVDPFTPERVEQETSVPAADLIAAARLMGTGTRGGATAGVGPNMSPRGYLSEYLLLAVGTLCGQWRREGDAVLNPAVMQPVREYRAQAVPQEPWWENPPNGRIKGLPASPIGMTTATLADEILLEGPGQIKALFVGGGNPAVNFPDQLKAVKALRKLDLLVTFDIVLSQTAKLAHYAFGTKMSFERPNLTGPDTAVVQRFGATLVGLHIPHAQYSPTLIEPPARSEVVEEWRILAGIAEHMGTPLEIDGVKLVAPYPTIEEMIEAGTVHARVPLNEIKRHEHGALFPVDVRVGPAEPDHARLNVGHPLAMEAIEEIAADPSSPVSAPPPGDGIEAIFACRRSKHLYNSTGQNLGDDRLQFEAAAAYAHPDDLRRLEVLDGDPITITSSRSSIRARICSDTSVLPGTVMMAHGLGPIPDGDELDNFIGANTNRLIDTDDYFEPFFGVPAMSAIPVRLSRV